MPHEYIPNATEFIWARGHAIPLDWLNSALNLRFTWKVSNVFKEILKPDRNNKVLYVKVQPDISVLSPRGGINSISDPSNFKLFFYDVLNEGEGKAYANLNTERISKAAENASVELRAAFLDNLTKGPSIWKEVSNERLNRRALMTEMGSTKQLPVDKNAHYTESVFKKVIDSYNYVVTNDAKSKTFKIELKSDKLPKDPHPDFVGWESGFKGPNEILLSIMGMRVNNNKGVSSNGKKMIVPIGTSETNITDHSFQRTGYNAKIRGEWRWIKLPYTQQYHFAVNKNAYKGDKKTAGTYPSKDNPLPVGVPVVFMDSIRTAPYYFQDPNNESKRRVVFWSKEKVGGTIKFPINVQKVLQKTGFLSKAYK